MTYKVGDRVRVPSLGKTGRITYVFSRPQGYYRVSFTSEHCTYYHTDLEPVSSVTVVMTRKTVTLPRR